MMKKILTLAITLAIVFGGLLSQPVLAVDCNAGNLSTKEAIQCGTRGASGDTTTADNAPTKLSTTIRDGVNLVSAIGGMLAVIMLVYAGLRYVTSAGNAEATKGARNIIIYVAVGLVIIALAQAIVHFVIVNVV